MQKYEPFYPQVRFRKGNLSSRFRTFQRFIRAKTIGEDYTEERLKERIAEREMIKILALKTAPSYIFQSLHGLQYRLLLTNFVSNLLVVLMNESL